MPLTYFEFIDQYLSGVPETFFFPFYLEHNRYEWNVPSAQPNTAEYWLTTFETSFGIPTGYTFTNSSAMPRDIRVQTLDEDADIRRIRHAISCGWVKSLRLLTLP